jgi:hypothetical protein
VAGRPTCDASALCFPDVVLNQGVAKIDQPPGVSVKSASEEGPLMFRQSVVLSGNPVANAFRFSPRSFGQLGDVQNLREVGELLVHF